MFVQHTSVADNTVGDCSIAEQPLGSYGIPSILYDVWGENEWDESRVTNKFGALPSVERCCNCWPRVGTGNMVQTQVCYRCTSSVAPKPEPRTSQPTSLVAVFHVLRDGRL